MKKKESVTLVLSTHEFLFIFNLSISRVSVSENIREITILSILVKVIRGLKRWIRERMELRRYLVLRFSSIRISQIGIKQMCHEAINMCKFDAGIERCSVTRDILERKRKVYESLEKNEFLKILSEMIYFLLVHIHHLSCFRAFNLVFHGLLIVVLDDFLVNSCIVPSRVYTGR